MSWLIGAYELADKCLRTASWVPTNWLINAYELKTKMKNTTINTYGLHVNKCDVAVYTLFHVL